MPQARNSIFGTREVVVNYRRYQGSMLENAQSYHHKLVAQIVCYNPEIYELETVKNAEKFLAAIAS
ncbi:MAG: hypothetical protein HC942_29420 [Microcoleus sp. SU_5_6]|nr:hypothetical protein [Microcoleus sp. SU_5_6]